MYSYKMKCYITLLIVVVAVIFLLIISCLLVHLIHKKTKTKGKKQYRRDVERGNMEIQAEAAGAFQCCFCGGDNCCDGSAGCGDDGDCDGCDNDCY